jgi:hypothetical protein
MNLQKTFIILSCICMVGMPLLSRSQESKEPKEKRYKVILIDHSEIIGTILSEDETQIVFMTLSQIEMVIPRDKIIKIELLGGEIVKGRYWSPDPNRTRLFIAPTARPLKSGQGYFSTYEIFFPMLAIGITDFFTAAGGITLLPFSAYQVLYLAPKITPIQVGEIDVAAGVLYIKPTWESESIGIAYGVATYGETPAGLTFGLGWGFAEGEMQNKPIVLLGGELRVTNSTKLITENWIPPDSDWNYLSIGMRFYGEHIAADFAFIYPTGAEAEGFPFMPWVGFAYNFGS